MAEFDNFRNGRCSEKSELIKNGGENRMKAILPVIDDFERGLAAVEESNDLAAVKEGIELLTYNKFKSYLETKRRKGDSDGRERISIRNITRL